MLSNIIWTVIVAIQGFKMTWKIRLKFLVAYSCIFSLKEILEDMPKKKEIHSLITPNYVLQEETF